MDNIGRFLHFMKEIVDKNNFILVEREASLEFMAGMGITMDELKSVILSLTPRDCFDGPEADRDSRYPGWVVAEFSPKAFGKTLYLKMSIKYEAKRCKCLSVKLYRDRSEVPR